MSDAEENLADRKDPGFLDHQCIAVCTDHEAKHCFPGSVVWMAHDLAHLVSHYRSGDGSRVALGPKVVG